MENPNPDGDETIAITQEEPTNTGTEEDLEQAKGQFLAALDKSRDEIHTGLEHLRNTWSRRCSRRGDLRRHEPPMSMLSERVFPLYFYETCTGDQFKTTMSCLPFENPSINSKLAKNITVCGSRYDLDPPKGSLLFFLGINICVSTYALRQLITLKKKHPDVDWKTVYSHIAQASSERRKLSYKKIIVTTAGPRNLQVADVGSGIKRLQQELEGLDDNRSSSGLDHHDDNRADQESVLDDPRQENLDNDDDNEDAGTIHVNVRKSADALSVADKKGDHLSKGSAGAIGACLGSSSVQNRNDKLKQVLDKEHQHVPLENTDSEDSNLSDGQVSEKGEETISLCGSERGRDNSFEHSSIGHDLSSFQLQTEGDQVSLGKLCVNRNAHRELSLSPFDNPNESQDPSPVFQHPDKSLELPQDNDDINLNGDSNPAAVVSKTDRDGDVAVAVAASASETCDIHPRDDKILPTVTKPAVLDPQSPFDKTSPVIPLADAKDVNASLGQTSNQGVPENNNIVISSTTEIEVTSSSNHAAKKRNIDLFDKGSAVDESIQPPKKKARLSLAVTKKEAIVIPDDTRDISLEDKAKQQRALAEKDLPSLDERLKDDAIFAILELISSLKCETIFIDPLIINETPNGSQSCRHTYASLQRNKFTDRTHVLLPIHLPSFDHWTLSILSARVDAITGKKGNDPSNATGHPSPLSMPSTPSSVLPSEAVILQLFDSLSQEKSLAETKHILKATARGIIDVPRTDGQECDESSAAGLFVPLVEWDDQRIHLQVEDCVQQTNDTDCGVAVIMNALQSMVQVDKGQSAKGPPSPSLYFALGRSVFRELIRADRLDEAAGRLVYPPEIQSLWEEIESGKADEGVVAASAHDEPRCAPDSQQSLADLLTASPAQQALASLASGQGPPSLPGVTDQQAGLTWTRKECLLTAVIASFTQQLSEVKEVLRKKKQTAEVMVIPTMSAVIDLLKGLQDAADFDNLQEDGAEVQNLIDLMSNLPHRRPSLHSVFDLQRMLTTIQRERVRGKRAFRILGELVCRLDDDIETLRQWVKSADS